MILLWNSSQRRSRNSRSTVSIMETPLVSAIDFRCLKISVIQIIHYSRRVEYFINSPAENKWIKRAFLSCWYRYNLIPPRNKSAGLLTGNHFFRLHLRFAGWHLGRIAWGNKDGNLYGHIARWLSSWFSRPIGNILRMWDTWRRRISHLEQRARAPRALYEGLNLIWREHLAHLNAAFSVKSDIRRVLRFMQTQRERKREYRNTNFISRFSAITFFFSYRDSAFAFRCAHSGRNVVFNTFASTVTRPSRISL